MKPFYAPRVVEIEMSHKCNLRCDGCAILGDVIADKYTIEEAKIQNFIQQMAENNLEAYALTGGEPFLFFKSVKKIIKESPIDLLKIDTNGFFFSSYTFSLKIFEELKAAGIANNKKLKAWLYISMGQQNIQGIPIENAVNAVRAFESVFKEEDNVGFGLNVFSPTNEHAYATLDAFTNRYLEVTGQELDKERHFLKHIPAEGQICSTAYSLGNVFSQQMSIKNLILYYLYEQEVSVNCVAEAMRIKKRYVSPRMLLRASGDLYTCPGFSHVHLLGNIYEQTLTQMLATAREDVVIKTVFKGGLLELLSLAEKYVPGISKQKISVSNGPCDICRILSDVISDYSLAKKAVPAYVN